jgi:hypothetical protein
MGQSKPYAATGLARGWFMSTNGYQAGVSSIGQFVMLNGEAYSVVVAAPTPRLRENEDGIAKVLLEACRAFSCTSIAGKMGPRLPARQRCVDVVLANRCVLATALTILRGAAASIRPSMAAG